jgi:Na+/melibiose symporter-like transporter
VGLDAEPRMRVFGELRRRNVFKVSVGYTILAWLLVKLVDSLLPVIGAGDRAIQIFTLLLILCFPVIVLFAWAYEITPEGLKPTSQVDKTQSITRETGRKLNYALLVLLGIAAVVFVTETYL